MALPEGRSTEPGFHLHPEVLEVLIGLRMELHPMLVHDVLLALPEALRVLKASSVTREHRFIKINRLCAILHDIV